MVTDGVWELLELCRSPEPETRPTARAILEYLERVSTVPEPLSPSRSGNVEMGGLPSAVGDPGMFPYPIPNPGFTIPLADVGPLAVAEKEVGESEGVGWLVGWLRRWRT